MAAPFDPGPRPRGLEPWLADIPDTLFDDAIYAACELAELYATELAVEIARELELERSLDAPVTVDELIEARGFAAAFRPALERLLDRLAATGVVERSGEPPRYRAVGPLPPTGLDALRATGDEIAPGAAATLDLLDAAAALYPEAARAGAIGEERLLVPAKVPLWLAYFSNDNPVYALSNRIAAVAAANRLPDRDGLRILELGAGAGSAASALLEELERRGRLADVALYDATEPSPFFRRRGERELRARFPATGFTFRALDLDLPFEEQGGAERFDLVYGVNVVHVADDLGAALARLRDALAPGGALVAGECFRLFPGQAVPADLVFQLFRGFTAVSADDAARPHHGFLAPESWRAAFEAAGFERVEVVPDLERIRDRYPRFFAGAVCGRRRSVQSVTRR